MIIKENETKLNMIVRFLSDIKSSQVYLGKRPASTVFMQDKAKRPINHQDGITIQVTKRKCARCYGPHNIKECKWPKDACFSCGKFGHPQKLCTEKVLPQIFCF